MFFPNSKGISSSSKGISSNSKGISSNSKGIFLAVFQKILIERRKH